MRLEPQKAHVMLPGRADSDETSGGDAGDRTSADASAVGD
jgi:hypothetical protein